MHTWQRHKDAWLLPVTTALHARHVTPWHVSIFGLALALLGTIISLATLNPWWFLLGLVLQVFGDGVDGALARNHQLTHRLGPLVDIAADYIGVLLALLITAYFTANSTTILLAVGITYGLLLAIAYRRSQRQMPFKLLPRGRLIFFILLALDLQLATITLSYALPVWLLVNLWFIATGSYALLKRYLPSS